jgi:hypothetical protein
MQGGHCVSNCARPLLSRAHQCHPPGQRPQTVDLYQATRTRAADAAGASLVAHS